nr:ATP synthase F0 subunit 8 [Cricotopus cf. montanus]
MPQMAPISWLILFFIFSAAFMLFNILNYYCFNYSNVKSNQNINNDDNNNVNNTPTKLNWKW